MFVADPLLYLFIFIHIVIACFLIDSRGGILEDPMVFLAFPASHNFTLIGINYGDVRRDRVSCCTGAIGTSQVAARGRWAGLI